MTMKDNLVSLYWQSNIHEQDQSLRIEVEARSRQTICWWRNPRDQKPVHGHHLILELWEDQNPLRVRGEKQFLQCPVQRVRLQIHFKVQTWRRCLYSKAIMQTDVVQKYGRGRPLQNLWHDFFSEWIWADNTIRHWHQLICLMKIDWFWCSELKIRSFQQSAVWTWECATVRTFFSSQNTKINQLS